MRNRMYRRIAIGVALLAVIAAGPAHASTVTHSKHGHKHLVRLAVDPGKNATYVSPQRWKTDVYIDTIRLNGKIGGWLLEPQGSSRNFLYWNGVVLKIEARINAHLKLTVANTTDRLQRLGITYWPVAD